MEEELDEFDWEFYLDAYPDLVRAGVEDEEGAHRHYLAEGRAEGRMATAPTGKVPWFMCLNDGAEMYKTMALCALASSLDCPKLERHVIYDGGDEDFVAKAQALGATVTRRRSSLYGEMEKVMDAATLRAASGAYMRLDIPEVLAAMEGGVEARPRYLYTDCDVVITCDPCPALLVAPPPATFRASSEFVPGPGEGYFNSGVMWCDTRYMLATLPALREFSVRRRFDFPAFDQGALNAYYGTGYDFLDIWFNWKPYWGVCEDAFVVHFHGPKPMDIVRYMAGEAPSGDNAWVYKPGDAANMKSYSHYLGLWQDYLELAF